MSTVSVTWRWDDGEHLCNWNNLKFHGEGKTKAKWSMNVGLWNYIYAEQNTYEFAQNYCLELL
jgi:hypothetical protein